MEKNACIDWMDSVAARDGTMSQRNIKWVEANGGLEKLVQAAKARRIHLVQLTDDKGNNLIAASRKPFTSLC